MVTFRRLAILPLVVASLFLTQPAEAGGWWSGVDLQYQHYGIGEAVRFRTEFLFASIEEAERARAGGHYYAYLLRGFDHTALEAAMTRPEPGDWLSLGDALAIRLGEIRLSGWSGNLAHGSIRFVVPDVEPGPYDLMLCDAGCGEPLGDVIPAPITIHEDAATARLARRLDRLDSRARADAWAIRRLRAALAGAPSWTDVQSVETDVAGLRIQIEGLEERLAASRARPAAAEVPWWAFAGWFVAGGSVGTGAALVFSRRRRPRVPDAVEVLVVPAERRDVGSGRYQ